MFDVEDLKDLLVIRVALVVGLLVLVVLGLMFQDKINAFLRRGNKSPTAAADVLVPSIVNGELILPKVIKDDNPGSNNLAFLSRLGVISANLIGVYDQQKKELSAIRIIGEAANSGSKTVDGISPVVRFFDKGDKVVGQKIGKLTPGFDFYGASPNDKTYYDVTVDSPPTSDKLEIVLNVASATTSAIFEPLKILSRNIEVKTATYQGPAEPTSSAAGAASVSAISSTSAKTAPPVEPEKIEYFTVTGSVINTLSSPISDISVYAWVRDKENKVFSFTRQDFKNDLLPTGEKLDFRLNLLPFKTNAAYDSYEVAAWGKEYKLNL